MNATQCSKENTACAIHVHVLFLLGRTYRKQLFQTCKLGQVNACFTGEQLGTIYSSNEPHNRDKPSQMEPPLILKEYFNSRRKIMFPPRHS